MIRDGRDVACSIIPQRWGPHTLKAAANRWVTCIEKGIKYRHDEKRYLEFRYENLVRDPETETKRVMRFLDEVWEEQILDFWRFDHDLSPRTESSAGQVIHSIHTESIGRWKRELSPRQINTFMKICGTTLEMLGYKK